MKHWVETAERDLDSLLPPETADRARLAIPRCVSYLSEVLVANQRVNLTAIREMDDALRLHLEDSLSALPEVDEAPEGVLLDIGTGGGFPGVPLGIATGRPVVLADSVRKKVAVVDEILAAMIPPIEYRTCSERVESIAMQEKGRYACVTARAVSELPALVELASPLLMDGGRLVALKAQLPFEEFERAERVAGMVGMSHVSTRRFKLPRGDEERAVVVFERRGKAKVTLPRRIGLAQNQPLA